MPAAPADSERRQEPVPAGTNAELGFTNPRHMNGLRFSARPGIGRHAAFSPTASPHTAGEFPPLWRTSRATRVPSTNQRRMPPPARRRPAFMCPCAFRRGRGARAGAEKSARRWPCRLISDVTSPDAPWPPAGLHAPRPSRCREDLTGPTDPMAHVRPPPLTSPDPRSSRHCRSREGHVVFDHEGAGTCQIAALVGMCRFRATSLRQRRVPPLCPTSLVPTAVADPRRSHASAINNSSCIRSSCETQTVAEGPVRVGRSSDTAVAGGLVCRRRGTGTECSSGDDNARCTSQR